MYICNSPHPSPRNQNSRQKKCSCRARPAASAVPAAVTRAQTSAAQSPCSEVLAGATQRFQTVIAKPDCKQRVDGPGRRRRRSPTCQWRCMGTMDASARTCRRRNLARVGKPRLDHLRLHAQDAEIERITVRPVLEPVAVPRVCQRREARFLQGGLPVSGKCAAGELRHTSAGSRHYSQNSQSHAGSPREHPASWSACIRSRRGVVPDALSW